MMGQARDTVSFSFPFQHWVQCPDHRWQLPFTFLNFIKLSVKFTLFIFFSPIIRVIHAEQYGNKKTAHTSPTSRRVTDGFLVCQHTGQTGSGIHNELTSLSEKNPEAACLSPAQHLHSSGLTPGDVWATGFLSWSYGCVSSLPIACLPTVPFPSQTVSTPRPQRGHMISNFTN